MSLLSVRHLSHTYPNGTTALRDISFAVERGEFVAVIGLSGSGKSTLLRSLNRLIEPSGGEILFQDKDTAHFRGSEVYALRRQIAMIFQHFNLIPRYSVLKNVLLGRLGSTSTLKSLLGLYTPEQLNQAHELLRMVGLDDKWRERADQLSGGQQQRVAIARALNQQPQILLADEPVASLDPATSYAVMNYLRKVNQELGLTVICNLHFLKLVREFASRVIALRDGQIVYQGSARQIDQQWFKQIYGEEAKELG